MKWTDRQQVYQPAATGALLPTAPGGRRLTSAVFFSVRNLILSPFAVDPLLRLIPARRPAPGRPLRTLAPFARRPRLPRRSAAPDRAAHLAPPAAAATRPASSRPARLEAYGATLRRRDDIRSMTSFDGSVRRQLTWTRWPAGAYRLPAGETIDLTRTWPSDWHNGPTLATRTACVAHTVCARRFRAGGFPAGARRPTWRTRALECSVRSAASSESSDLCPANRVLDSDAGLELPGASPDSKPAVDAGDAIPFDSGWRAGASWSGFDRALISAHRAGQHLPVAYLRFRRRSTPA